MPRRSAGLLPYHHVPGGPLQLFLAHPGGPFFANRDEGAWTIAKGEHGPEEEPLAAARREFAEEIGRPAPEGPVVELGEVRQPGGKVVTAFAVRALPGSLTYVASNTFPLEWPSGSGRVVWYPEADRAEWMSEENARRRLGKGQVAFVDRLLEQLAGDEGLSAPAGPR